jgi:hypothetical protein
MLAADLNQVANTTLILRVFITMRAPLPFGLKSLSHRRDGRGADVCLRAHCIDTVSAAIITDPAPDQPRKPQTK